MRRMLSTATLTLLLASAAAAMPRAEPIPVTPGAAHGIVTASQPCPTFAWGAVEGASAYELAVFEVFAGGDSGHPTEDLHTAPVLRVEIDAPATAWAPGAGECLKPGRSYAWTVRELGTLGAGEAEWALPLLFRIPDAEEIAALGGGRPTWGELDEQEEGLSTRSNPGNSGNAGPPGVLAAIEELSQLVQLQHSQIDLLINQRADLLEAQIGVNDIVDPEQGGTPSLASRIATLQAGLLPCTPEKLAEGRCDDNHPLDLEVTVCANLGAGAGLDASYQIAPTAHLHAGAGWSLVADVSAVAQLELPLLLGPIPLPTLGLGANAGFTIGADGCLGGIRIPIGKSIEEELLYVIDGFTQGANELTVQVASAAGQLELGVSRVGGSLQLLHSLRDPVTGIGPFFEEIRDQVEGALPVGSRVGEVLDEVGSLADQIAGLDCQEMIDAGVPGASEICGFVDGQVRLDEIAVALEALDDLASTLSNLGSQIQNGFNDVLSDLSPLDPIYSVVQDVCRAIDKAPWASCKL